MDVHGTKLKVKSQVGALSNRSDEEHERKEANCFDNPIYGNPSDILCTHATNKDDCNGGFSKAPYKRDSEDQIGNRIMSEIIDDNASDLECCEASPSSRKMGVKNERIYNVDSIPGEVKKSCHYHHLKAAHQTVHCSSPDGPSKIDNKCSMCKNSLLPEQSALLKANMSEMNTSVSKETSNVNIGKIKNKLAKSSSFKTETELQKLSRLGQEHVLLIPVKRAIVSQGPLLKTFISTHNCQSDEICDTHEDKMECVKSDKGDIHPVLVPLVFRNELYNMSNSQEEGNKNMDSGNISSESLFTHEEDVSDSGASHKSGLTSSAQSRESIQDHSDLLADDTSREELESSREEIWSTDGYEDVPIPEGWRKDVDDVSGEHCYINEVTQAKWFSSTDGKGRVYFFEENSDVSTWTLPNIVIGDEPQEPAPQNDQQVDTSDLALRNQDGDKKSVSRVGKARSLFLSDQKHKETSGKSSSIPRNWLQQCGLDKDVLKHGNLNRTKITENGKKVSKKWAAAFVVLTEDALCFFKDVKTSQHSGGLQPELSMQLTGAKVESGEKLSSRKHVFLITSGGLQLLCECSTAEYASQWQWAIGRAIAKLHKPPVVQSTKHVQDKPRIASIARSKSLQVKNREGAFEDASNEEQQMKIRDRLKKFFNRRPTREILASKGIYKDEPVFDSHLKKVCPPNPPYIPEFVQLCIAAIESKDENMKTDGLYRASGNLSHVQKIRLQVDQNNLSVLEAEEDVHVLTGALKLFFRELKEPLIPYELFNEAIDAGGMNGSKKEKIKIFRAIVKKLPPPNHDTLKFLLQHLRRVTQYEEFNRMHVPNLAIVFGPTLMWREKEYHQNMAIEYMQQNLVIEFFLQQFDEIFR